MTFQKKITYCILQPLIKIRNIKIISSPPIPNA